MGKPFGFALGKQVIRVDLKVHPTVGYLASRVDFGELDSTELAEVSRAAYIVVDSAPPGGQASAQHNEGGCVII
jgi:hypothetical protein